MSRAFRVEVQKLRWTTKEAKSKAQRTTKEERMNGELCCRISLKSLVDTFESNSFDYRKSQRAEAEVTKRDASKKADPRGTKNFFFIPHSKIHEKSFYWY